MKNKDPSHTPVLINEVARALSLKNGDDYLDLTLGAGGHTRHLLNQATLQVVGVDRDPSTATLTQDIKAKWPHCDFEFINETFDVAAKGLIERKMKFDGILADLGMSSVQLDDPKRGFSFLTSTHLDLRMNPQVGRPASEWLMNASEKEIENVLRTLGEEPKAHTIAKAIRDRLNDSNDLFMTEELRKMIEQIYRSAYSARSRTHPAAKTFQAIRMYINSELIHLENLLPLLPSLLKPGGRICFISFHSLEDRLVKTYLKRESTQCLCPPETPVCVCHHKALFELIKPYPQRPTPQEVKENPRCRSAILRASTRRDVLI